MIILHLLFQSPKIQVWLMDGTYRMLNLVSGANTTVQQLHAQMVTVSTSPVNIYFNILPVLFRVNAASKEMQLGHLQDRNLKKNMILKYILNLKPV